ncbi:hypothetical protein P3S67_004042 [Capsicum chacoense]
MNGIIVKIINKRSGEEESVKMSFNYTKVKSCTKYLRVRCVDPTCRWMVPHVLSENRVGFMFTSKWESILVAFIMLWESTKMSPWRSLLTYFDIFCQQQRSKPERY